MALQMEIELDVCMQKLNTLLQQNLLSKEEYEKRANELSAKMDDMKTYLENRSSMKDTYPSGTTHPHINGCLLNREGVDIGYVKVNAYCVLCRTFKAAMMLDEWRCHSCQGLAFLFPPPKEDQEHLRRELLFDSHRQEKRAPATSSTTSQRPATIPQLKASEGPKLLAAGKREGDAALTPAAKMQRISDIDVRATAARYGASEMTPETVKDAGTAAYKKAEYFDAVALWSHAVKLAPKSTLTHLLHSNLSQGYLLLSMHSKALAEAQKCVTAAPEWDKGYLRKAGALHALKHISRAMVACNKGLSLPAQARIRTSSGIIATDNACRVLLEEKLQELRPLAAKVEELKEAGNAAVQEEKWAQAIASYTSGINVDASNHLLFSNRSLCHLKNKNLVGALADADTCIELEPTWPKGFLRRAAALEARGQKIEAAQAEETAEQLLEQQKRKY